MGVFCGSDKDKKEESDMVAAKNSDVSLDLQELEKKVNSVVSNVFSLTDSLLNQTSDIFVKTGDHLKSDLKSWLIDEELPEDHISVHKFDLLLDDLFKGKVDSFDRSILTNDTLFNHDNVFNTIFQPLLNSGIKQGKTPFGFYAYPTPSPSLYNQCSKLDGESLWDEYGYWRCLFPKSVIPDKSLAQIRQRNSAQIITKDDFENEGGLSKADPEGVIDLGSKGKFFKNFNDYLNWKNIMMENIKREEDLKRQQFQQKLERQLSETIETNGASNYIVSTRDNKTISDNDTAEGITDKKVVHTSKSYTYSESGDGIVKTEKIQKWFSDGSSILKEIQRQKKPEQENWDVTENVHELGPQLRDGNLQNLSENLHFDDNDFFNELNNNRKGWFWDTKSEK